MTRVAILAVNHRKGPFILRWQSDGLGHGKLSGTGEEVVAARNCIQQDIYRQECRTILNVLESYIQQVFKL